MFWTPYVFVRLVGWLILGIAFYFIFEPNFSYWVELFGILTLCYGFLFQYIHRQKSYQFASIFGNLAFLLVFIFGIALTDLKTPHQHPNHFINFKDSVTHFEAVLVSDLSEKPKSYKAEVQISRVYSAQRWHFVKSKAIIYFQKSTLFTDFHYGTKIIAKGFPHLIRPPKNPETFDYQSYLKNKGIYHQLYLPQSAVMEMGEEPLNWGLNFAYQIRRFCADKLRKYVPNPESASIVVALVLGLKDGISHELREVYTSAGVIHVLAVSGLHVGIIFMLISKVFHRLNDTKKGKLLFTFLVIGILFLYALITGFSPSVVRSMVMFSCFTWATASQRGSNIYNTIAFSAFVMLCYNPYFLIEVGFQLSYLAVIGIVYFYPKLYPLWTPPWKVLRFFWQLIVVSVSAQIAVTPISLYYFHQFSVYFLLANALIVPLIPCLIGLSLGTLGLSFLDIFSENGDNILAQFLGEVLSKFMMILNTGLTYVNRLPFYLVENVSISVFEMILLYGVIVGVSCLFYFRKFWILWFVLSCSVIFCGQAIYKYWNTSQQRQLVIYSLKSANVAFIDGHEVTLLSDSITVHNQNQLQTQLGGHWRKQNIRIANFFSFPKSTRKKYITLAKFNKISILINPKKREINLNKIPNADILILDYHHYNELLKLNKNKFIEIIITHIPKNIPLTDLKQILAKKCQKFTLIHQNHSFIQSF